MNDEIREFEDIEAELHSLQPNQKKLQNMRLS